MKRFYKSLQRGKVINKIKINYNLKKKVFFIVQNTLLLHYFLYKTINIEEGELVVA